MIPRKAGLTLLAGVLLFVASLTAQDYHLARTLPVPGEGAWDYIVFDGASHRLFVPHGTRVQVLNPDTGAQLGVIENTPGVHGIAIVPDSNRGYVTNGHAGTVSVIDLKTYQHLAEIPAGKDPDSILYEPFTRRLFVSNGESSDLTVIDPEADKVLATIPARGAPEYAVSDGAGHMWVNLEDRNAIAVVDPSLMRIVRLVKLPGCSQPTSLALDATSKRLFVGCRNRLLAVVAADTGRTIARLPIGEHVDGTIYDATRYRVLVSSGDGVLTTVRQVAPDRYVVEGGIPTLRGAKTLAIDRATGTLYLPTMKRVPPPAFGPPRASGTMAYPPSPLKVLVFER